MMKKSFIFTRFILGLSLVGLLNNCNKVVEQTCACVLNDCKVLQSINTLQSDSDKQTEMTDYQYDTEGKLTKISLTINRAQSGSLSTETYSYDTDGFLMARNKYNTYTSPVKQSTENQTFTYKNGLLSTSETRMVDVYGRVTKSSESYTYDATGKLITRQQNTVDGSIILYSYASDEKLVSVLKKKTGVETTYLVKDGLILDSGDAKYTYNDKKRMIKYEIYANGKLNSYATYDWNDALPAIINVLKFKGFPCETTIGLGVGMSETMNSIYPLNKFQFFADVLGNGKQQQLNESVFSVQKNSNGLVSKIDLFNKQFQLNPNDPPNTIKSTQTFTYINCN